MTISTMTIADLCLSPYNVRTNQADANAIDGMAESLLRVGQLYPLAVHKMPRATGKGGSRCRQLWGVLAGGRRFRAFERLIADGRLPASHPIDVIVRDIASEAELIELSLAENLVRFELRAYEVYAAVHRAHAGGRSFAEIAQTNGQTVETVRQWDRLGALEPEIFAALSRGEIGKEQAKAFAATNDHALQRWAFDQVMTLPESHPGRQPTGIRRIMKVGDNEQRKLLRFVDDYQYRKAGGRFELDLFADQPGERGRVTDEGLLMQMVEAKLSVMRDRLRGQANVPLRFEATYPRDSNYGGVAIDLEITPQWGELSAEQQDRLDYLANEMAEIEQRAAIIVEPGADREDAQLQAAMEPLEEEWAALREEQAQIEATRSLTLPAGDVFATLVIEQEGEVEMRFWWASRKAMAAAQKAGKVDKKPVSAGPIRKADSHGPVARPVTGAAALIRTDYTAQPRADAQIREEHGLTQDAIQSLRSMRRMALRAGLIAESWHQQSSGVALDYLLWSLARDKFGNRSTEAAHERGIAGLSTLHDPAPIGVEAMADATTAGAIWHEAVAALRDHPSMTDGDPVAAYHAFRAEDWRWKEWAASVVAGSVLARSADADGYRVPLHDELADLCGFADDEAVRGLIEPGEALVEMLPRSQRLALAEPHVDGATFRGWQKLKAAELVAPVTRALRHAKAFVHPMLRFRANTQRSVPAAVAEDVAA
ncbi:MULTISPECIES: ParB/RepB/Spo0J family partition protein [unclassified Sphingobium]|uniref:ParB/RepB/Spo0J family partition protein n=1 Tax=unclassified Sphingobium TaxID=2611147 RepID=UPI0022243559|nr:MULTISPECIES: ParB/RepB/Spo0J family partition protein [unclassified Sphingobium]MCW2412039.1 ParB family chromosome partitioning protein [Sphingobium sp. B8D3D]MCW2415664.1 ParB family chromosome partitioning protein [Sphingobium sp. B8D3A]